MKRLLFIPLLLFSLAASAQSLRVYYVGSTQMAIADADGSNVLLKPTTQVTVQARGGTEILVSYGTGFRFLLPAQFLNSSGTAYGGSVTSALTTFLASAPVGSGGSGIDSTARNTANAALSLAQGNSTAISANTVSIANAEPGVLKFATYALAVAGLSGRTKPARVLITADEVNNAGAFGKYDYDGTTLIEDIL